MSRVVFIDEAKRDRLDLLLTDRRDLAVIEVKALAGPGYRQLQRYEESTPAARCHVAIFPERLPMDTSHAPKWLRLTWEQVLDAYQRSRNQWLRILARAWSAHFDETLPKVTGETAWNDLPDGVDFVVSMRTRLS